MTPEKLRMTHNAVRLGVRELTEKTGVSFTTISRFETGKSGLQHPSAEVILKALAARGVQLFEAGQVTEGVGVALKRVEP
jgi:transcriptional regulator with XRE-family HTH domain